MKLGRKREAPGLKGARGEAERKEIILFKGKELGEKEEPPSVWMEKGGGVSLEENTGKSNPTRKNVLGGYMYQETLTFRNRMPRRDSRDWARLQTKRERASARVPVRVPHWRSILMSIE